MRVTFTETAWKEYMNWQTEDRRTIKKINDLIKDIQRNGFMNGMGKPEPLKYRTGFSRRIDNANRLEYDDDGEKNLLILTCKGRYED
jgi:toxin YoeB